MSNLDSLALSLGLGAGSSLHEVRKKLKQSIASADLGGEVLAELISALAEEVLPLQCRLELTELLALLSLRQPELVANSLGGLGVHYESAIERELGGQSGEAPTGPLATQFVVCLLRVTKYALSPSALLEACSGSTASGVATLARVLRLKDDIEPELWCGCAEILHGLTLPTTYFGNDSDRNDTPIAQLTQCFILAVRDVCDACIQFDVLQCVVEAVMPMLRRQASARAVHGLLPWGQEHAGVLVSRGAVGLLRERRCLIRALRALLCFVRNLLLFAPSAAEVASLRRHVTTSTSLATECLAPYVWLLTDAVTSEAAAAAGKMQSREEGSESKRCVDGGESSMLRDDLRTQLLLTLEALIVVTFRVRSFRRFFCQHNVTLQLLRVDWIRSDVRAVEILVRLNVNLDAVRVDDGFSTDDGDNYAGDDGCSYVGSSRSMKRHRLAKPSDQHNVEVSNSSARAVLAEVRDLICALSPEDRHWLHRQLCDARQEVALPIARQNESCARLAFAFDALHFEIEMMSDGKNSSVGGFVRSGRSASSCSDGNDVSQAPQSAAMGNNVALHWLGAWLNGSDSHFVAERDAKAEGLRFEGNETLFVNGTGNVASVFHASPCVHSEDVGLPKVQTNMTARIVSFSRDAICTPENDPNGDVETKVEQEQAEVGVAGGKGASHAKLGLQGRQAQHASIESKPDESERKQNEAKDSDSQSMMQIRYRPHHIAPLGVKASKPKLGPPKVAVPVRFQCCIGGHLMVDPVISPFGDIFDRVTVTEHLGKSGERCPVDPTRILRVEDLAPAPPELQAELTAYRFEILMRRGL